MSGGNPPQSVEDRFKEITREIADRVNIPDGEYEWPEIEEGERTEYDLEENKVCLEAGPEDWAVAEESARFLRGQVKQQSPKSDLFDDRDASTIKEFFGALGRIIYGGEDPYLQELRKMEEETKSKWREMYSEMDDLTSNPLTRIPAEVGKVLINEFKKQEANKYKTTVRSKGTRAANDFGPELLEEKPKLFRLPTPEVEEVLEERGLHSNMPLPYPPPDRENED